MKKKTDIPQKQIMSNKWAALIFLIVSFILYGNTLGNKYCLDDAIVITQNKFTQEGFRGIDDIFATESFTGFFGESKALVSGARYRPLSIATFAIEQQIFGESPAISHFINIVLYFLTGLLLFLALQQIIPLEDKQKMWVAFISTLLFLFHPVHTEAVANIKGRDEIMALLFSLISIYYIFKFYMDNKVLKLIIASISFFLALLSKENAFFVIILLPLLLYALGHQTLGKMFKAYPYLIGATVIYFIIRHSVTGDLITVKSDELMNNSFLHASVAGKYATIMFTLGVYLKLLVFPHPLTYDYYPYHIPLMDWSSGLVWLSFFLYLAMVLAAIYYFRKKIIISIAIAFYLIPLAPVSNILFPIGVFMNERFLYISSIGFCIVVGYYTFKAYELKKLRMLVLVVLPVLFILIGFKTIDRNKAWYNDYTLFTTDVKTSVNSAKSNCSAGGILMESTDTITNNTRKQQILRQSVGYLQKAVSIHPTYIDAWLLLGNAYFKMGTQFDSTIICYTTILNINPQHQLTIKNLLAVNEHIAEVDKKLQILELVLKYDPANYLANYKLGQLYGKEKGDLDRSIHYLTKAAEIDPSKQEAFIDLGVAYGLKKEFAKSASMLEKAVAINPNDPNVLMNLGLSYQFMGDMNKARVCFVKADSLKRH
ncbi:MAG TPA: glycosyltransferase family 39 protein [Bacteroidales bacterium]|nr:glycosyltransferase family 39 protein [Bacteroidales bacterium]